MIEEKWFSEKAFDDQMMMCDQLAMAVFIKPEIASKTEIFHVSFKTVHLICTRLIISLDRAAPLSCKVPIHEA